MTTPHEASKAGSGKVTPFTPVDKKAERDRKKATQPIKHDDGFTPVPKKQ